MGTEIQKTDLSNLFLSAVSNQMTVLTNSTGKTESEIKSILISFAYATKQMLEASKQPIGNIDPMSIKEAFKNMLDTGIPVDKRQLAYVVKYGNQIQYTIGYKGFIHRIKEIYATAQPKAELVYAGDVFSVEKVDGQARYTHKVANPFAKIKDLVGAYAYVRYTDNGKEYSFIETMSKEEIDKIRGKAKTAFVWNEWYGEMAKKAVIRRLCKTLFIGDPKIAIMEELDNKSFDIRQEPLKVDYDKPEPMPEEMHINKADIISEPQDVEVKNDTETEGAFDNMYLLEKIEKKAGKTKSGRDYVLNILHLEGGLQVKTFDDKPFVAGQTVELIEWDKEKGQCKRVNIL